MPSAIVPALEAKRIDAGDLQEPELSAQMRFGAQLDPAPVQPLCDVAARYGMLRPMKASDILRDGT